MSANKQILKKIKWRTKVRNDDTVYYVFSADGKNVENRREKKKLSEKKKYLQSGKYVKWVEKIVGKIYKFVGNINFSFVEK